MSEIDQWDSFLCQAHPDCGFVQSRWWSDLQAAFGWEHFGAIFRDGTEILGGARILTESFEPGYRYFYIAEGPVLPANPDDAEQLFGAVLEYADQARARFDEQVSHLRLEPRWISVPSYAQGFRLAGGWLEPRDTLQVDLSGSIDDLLAQMKPKGRYNVRLAQRKGVQVVKDTSADAVEQFCVMYSDMSIRKGLKPRSRRYIRAVTQTVLTNGHGTLFCARYADELVAAALVVQFGHRTTYLFGASSDSHRPVMAPYLLQFEAMCHARSVGSAVYDLYGIAPPGKPGHQWAGITEFKRKFGGTELHFVPALDLIYDQQSYDRYRQAAR